MRRYLILSASVLALAISSPSFATDKDDDAPETGGEPGVSWLKDHDTACLCVPYPGGGQPEFATNPTHTLTEALARNEQIKEHVRQ